MILIPETVKQCPSLPHYRKNNIFGQIINLISIHKTERQTTGTPNQSCKILLEVKISKLNKRFTSRDHDFSGGMGKG